MRPEDPPIDADVALPNRRGENDGRREDTRVRYDTRGDRYILRMHDRMRLPGRGTRRTLVIFCAIALTLTVVARSAAHDTWLISATNFGRVGAPFRLDLTSGETFPVDDFAIAANRVARAQVREGGGVRPLPRPATTPLTLEYLWTPRAPGVSTIGIELQPKVLVLDPKLIEEYLTEIDASDDIRAAWKALGGKQKWTESYTKNAMTFVRVAPGKSDSNWTADKHWTRPMGLALELLPERDPTALRAGDTLLVRVLRHGAPLSGFSVGALREGRGKATFVHTDAAGRAAVVVDAGGRWLLNGTYLRRAASNATVWESDFVTATIHVAPRP
jgi:uncharacterized GH25 family protein